MVLLQVAKYKRLDGGIEFVASIPKSAAGKILRKDLKEIFEKKFGKK
jgi:4-coumarate--CoA ligase